jgi:hypothetical protein
MSEFLNLSDALFEGVGEYRIPRILPTTELFIKDWIQFNYVATTKKHREVTGVQFFVYDHQFERVWNYPKRYADRLKEFGAVLSPDFSTYLDFPKAVQVFQHYRKHWCGAYWQLNGVTVIPTISWGYKDSYEWCFDGEPEGGIVAVSNIGKMNNKEYRKLFMDGYNEMLIRLQPKEVLLFGHIFDDYKGPVHYIKYQQEKGPQGYE